MSLTKEQILEEIGGLSGLVDILVKSLRKTLDKDGDILIRGQSERTFIDCWAEKIRSISPEIISKNLKVNTSYDKHGDDPKRDFHDRRIEVDLVIHVRGTDDFNIFAMEAETSNYPAGDDIEKLAYLTSQDEGYKYSLGLYIALGVKKKAGTVLRESWFINGQESAEIGKPITVSLIKSQQN